MEALRALLTSESKSEEMESQVVTPWLAMTAILFLVMDEAVTVWSNLGILEAMFLDLVVSAKKFEEMENYTQTMLWNEMMAIQLTTTADRVLEMSSQSTLAREGHLPRRVSVRKFEETDSTWATSNETTMI
jgi:hypothetical protein